MPDANRPLSEGKIAALRRLKLAYDDAEDAGEEPAQFAAKAAELMADGATSSDLLWLLKLRYVKHVREITRHGEPRRQFLEATTPALTPDSCFFLTSAGNAYVNENGLERHAGGAKASSGRSSAPWRGERIQWDRERHELLVDGKLAKRFTHAAPAQWAALDEFQLDGWKGPVKIDPPGDPQRDAAQRLRELVADLNRGLDTSLICFRKDCEGLRVTFDLP